MNPSSLKLRRARKLILLCAVICASHLYGMEPKYDYSKDLGNLSPEVQVMIIQALNNTYDKNLSSEKNLIQTVNAIKAMSRTNQQLYAVVNDLYGNKKGFTKLVHVLANKFNTTTQNVALQFKTPVAKEYIRVNNKFVAARKAKADELLSIVQNLLKDGLDPNYSWTQQDGSPINILSEVLYNVVLRIGFGNYIPLVELLLKNGAIPSDDIINTLNFKIQEYLNLINQGKVVFTLKETQKALEVINKYRNK